jgi:predicted Zn-dependent peptidase
MIEPARKVAVRSYQISMQRRRRQVLELAERALLGQSIYEVNNTLNQIQAVEAEEVAAVAQEFFRPELFVAGVVPGSRP